MMKTKILNRVFALSLLLFSVQALGAPNKPNVVIILADDMGAEAVNSYGGEYFTPNIDRLAREGQLFVNGHATPMCTPTRVRLMTGRESAKNYKAFGYLDPKERTIGNAFQAVGYKTAIVGKWQLSGNEMSGKEYDGKGADPQSAGFETSYLWQQTSMEAMGSRYWGPTISENGVAKRHEDGFGPRLQNDFALKFISENKAKPFLLYLPMTLPHDPYVPTPSSPDAKTPKERYAGMVTYLDGLVGELLDKLDEEGLRRNTIVVFVGDNGTGGLTSYRNGKPVQGGKGTTAVTGTNVPLILSWPGHIPSEVTRTALFDVMDLFPTLADLAKLPVPQHIDGLSQKEVLVGRKASVRSWIFMHYAPNIYDPTVPIRCPSQPARFIFDTRWKLYADGSFARIDAGQSSEVPADPSSVSAEGAARRAEFQKLLDGMGDGPAESHPACKLAAK